MTDWQDKLQKEFDLAEQARARNNEGQARVRKDLSELGVKLTLMVPKELQGPARDICWKNGLAAKANIGSFDVLLNI